MTHRLYYDSDALEFDAEIVDHDGDPTRVVLDRTAFYPTSGGQPHDTGTLNGVNVFDVIDRDEHIVHLLDSPLPLGPVHGEVDAIRRRDYTVQHTAQHLLSAIASDRFGWETSSAHFGTDHSTIEFDTPTVNDNQLVALESACNDAIAAAIPVRVRYADAASATGLRKPAERTGTIRIVSIDGVDDSACGGTHVTTTARLGSLFVADVERIRGRVRVGYLAGDRVRAALRSRNTLLHQLADATAIGESELVDVIPRRLEQLREHEKQLRALRQEVVQARVSALLSGAPKLGGVRRLLLDQQFGPLEMLRLAVEYVANGSNAICIGSDAASLTILLGASDDSGVNAGAVLKSALAAAGGRGGGSARTAQGSVPNNDALNQVLAALESA